MVNSRQTRELRVRLPSQKWDLLEECVTRGVAATYAGVVLLALESFHDKLLERDLREARLKRLEDQG
jgi:hypothetical protein